MGERDVRWCKTCNGPQWKQCVRTKVVNVEGFGDVTLNAWACENHDSRVTAPTPTFKKIRLPRRASSWRRQR